MIHSSSSYCVKVLKLYAFSRSCNAPPGHALTASFLFFQRWHQSSSLQSLPGLQTWDNLLWVLTSCLIDLAFATTIGSTHRALATGVRRCIWVRYMEHLGCLWAIWGDLQLKCSQHLVGRLLGRVHNAVSRLRILFMPSESYLPPFQFFSLP